MPLHRWCWGAAALGCAAPITLAAQTSDTTAQLPARTVTVTRIPTPLPALGAAVSVVDSAGVQRGRLSTNLDEALAFVPGVVAQNQWNYSIDERVSIRGFGDRANFGLRGVKLLIDGVPQTQPDGQSQLSDLNLSLVSRVEVLRGGSSALYGNASGGVLSFTTNPVPTAPWTVTAEGEGGSFGSGKEELVTSARSGPVGGTLALSRFSTDGFREQSAATQRRVALSVNWSATPSTVITARVNSADDPTAENPGALTAAELARNPDSAAAGNILRGANKAVTQTEGSVGVHHAGGRVQWDVTAYGLTRDVVNPLATPPPAPAATNEGTFSTVSSLIGGFRASATMTLGRPTLTAGADAQSLADDRVNKRSVAGVATDTFLVNQHETVTEIGPFLQAAWPLGEQVTLRAGVRHDDNHFAVQDHFLADGDGSGSRTMPATSGNGGITVRLGRDVTVWTDAATVFDTPTTTELANQPSGAGGFNPDLGPQRSVTEEAGARGRAGTFTFDAAVYHTNTNDAIVPYNEVGGRTYYDNAGQIRTEGAELAVTWTFWRHVQLLGTWTHTDATYTNYLIVNPTSVDTLNGHHVAGLPKDIGRIGLRGSVGSGFTIDLDQGFSSGMFGDDDNRIPVAGWGAGVTGARVAWHGRIGGLDAAPFVAALNLFDRNYIGAVTVNGAAGRVFEPAARRTIYAGAAFTASGK